MRQIIALTLAFLGTAALGDSPCSPETIGKPQMIREWLEKPQAKFAFDFHRNLPAGPPNRLSSPLSAYTALGLLLAGAGEKTREEIAHLLHPKISQEQGMKVLSQLYYSITCSTEYQNTVALLSNRVFRQKGKELKPEYVEAIQKFFNSSLGEVDFIRKKDQAAQEINRWVSENTRGKIDSIVDAQTLTSETKLFLVNALYVLGTWSHQFPEAATKNGPFHREFGRPVQVPLMSVKGGASEFRYGKFDDFEAVNLQFSDGYAWVTFLLPGRGKKLADLMRRMDDSLWAKIRASLEGRAVELTLPRFKIASEFQLGDTLKAMGMKLAFIPMKANFDGIDGGADHLFVSGAIQKTSADVNEKGFEGAAVTAFEMRAGSAPPKPTTPVIIRFDRPFAFVVHRPVDGSIWFIGEVKDPSR